MAFGAAGLLALLAGWGITAFAALAAVIFIVALPALGGVASRDAAERSTG